MLFRNISISLLKDSIYNVLSWLSEFAIPIRMYLKFRFNLSERSISKSITNIVCGSMSFNSYYDVLMGGFKNDSVLLVSTILFFDFIYYLPAITFLGDLYYLSLTLKLDFLSFTTLGSK